MKKAAVIMLSFVGFLALGKHESIAQTGGITQDSAQMRMECTGTFRSTKAMPPGPDVAKIISTFVIDFAQKTVIDAANNVAATNVRIDSTTIDFQTATGGVERLSRLDGSWMVSSPDGAIAGTCKQVVDKKTL